jgi:hypothetical protein
MSHSRLLPLLLVTTLAAGITTAPAPAHAQTGGSGIVITDVNLTGLNYDPLTGLLTATGGTVSGTFAGLPFTTNIEDFSLQLLPDDGSGLCSILHLELAPIDLDLLGLHVDTSAICLDLTAIEGGGLLGDLLCGLAGGDLLLLPDLLDALPGLLTDLLGEGAAPSQAGAEDICDGECEILDLALGPVDLTLLGLNIHLDNCDDGPVQVCVSASEGEGLLGDLLCGLAGGGGLLDLGDLLALLDAITGIDGIADLDLTANQLDKLVTDLTKALADGTLSTKELNKLVKTITSFI